LKVDETSINRDLKRRMKGYGRGGRMSIERDSVRIEAGLRKGKTIGSPIGILITNRDFKIDKLEAVTDPRPGHADLAGMMKYNTADARDILERASARETAARVAVGGIAKCLLAEYGIRVISHVIQIGKTCARTSGQSFKEIAARIKAAKNINCADKKSEKLMCVEIDKARKAGDTLGGVFEVIVDGAPAGLGSHAQWDKRIDSAIARAVMAIPAVKAVSLGDGIEAAGKTGSSVHDEISYSRSRKAFTRLSNNAGGIEGGITNGEPITVKGFMKPIATLASSLKTVNMNTKKATLAAKERADVCAVSACGVVAEAVIAFEIASAFLEKFGGDSVKEISRNYEGYLKQLRSM
jgi:chorismate synthase